MNKTRAKRIGSNLALVSVLIGIVIAYIMFGTIYYSWAPLWILEYEFANNVVVGAVGTLIIAYFFGQLAGIDILIRKRNEYWIGIMYGILVLVSGTLIGCSVEFVNEGIDDIWPDADELPGVNPFLTYYVVPLAFVMAAGAIPAVVVGLWFGRRIKKQGQKEMVV